jgi:hypothetical protein
MRDKQLILYAVSLLAAVVAAASLIRCDSVPLTATTGSELSITANPTAIPAFNGVSTITVTGFKGPDDGGGPLPDGTQIFFTTNVGVIEERAEMQNGVARGFLRSDGRAGLAAVVARSGAGITAELANPVLVGNAEGINILVTANPSSVRPPNFTSNIVATVFDNDNNALSDVPLVFSTTAGALASESSILRTNQLGQASDRLTLENEQSATVTATSGSVSGSTTVTRGTINNPIVSSVFPSSGELGDTLNVTITGLNFQPGATVSFGQGISINSITFIDGTQLVVSITIDTGARVETQGRTVSVTNPDGGSGSLSDAFLIITPGAAPTPRILTVTPSTGSQNTTLNVSITGTDFQATPSVGFGAGITVNSVTFNSSTNLSVNITIDPLAATGFRDVTVVNPDGGTATFVSGFQVIP